MSRLLDSIYLGMFLGLAEAAEQLRGETGDTNLVDRLIVLRKLYREEEARELSEQLRGDTITNLEEIVTKRMPQ